MTSVSSPLKKQKLLLTFALLTSRMSAFIEPLNNCKVVSSLTNVPPGSMIIGTHDGSFHCDEVLAISMLSFLPAYQPSPSTFILRTRKPELLEQCNIVVDVGAVYDASTHRYDHHQRTFTDCLEGFNTKLSSAGLVYKHFGKDIVREILRNSGGAGTCSGSSEENELVNVCYLKLYKDFMEHIDAIDNGITIADTEPRYHVSTTLSSRVGTYNPAWNEPQTPEIVNEQFAKAILLTGSEFLQHAEGLFKSWWPARAIVQNSISQREEDQIIVLSQACPWKDHLFELEAEMEVKKPILYALYPDQGGSWRIQAVPISPNSFESRKKLPTDWCGVRDQALSDKSGIEGCIFVHASGFIGGNASKEGAIAMAKKALEI
mmetsp:Transcript_17214/g.28869  ORF Transcript_17214/g.28869 Transcript_17214/m.28869 type:complete len:375 (-) Transcript_17214:244-1368(-)